MNKWKKRGKRTLLFFLMLGFLCGMMDHLQITAAAPDAVTGDASSDTKSDGAGEAADPVCVCTDLCTADPGEGGCMVCAADFAACSGAAAEENEAGAAKQPEENNGAADGEEAGPQDDAADKKADDEEPSDGSIPSAGGDEEPEDPSDGSLPSAGGDEEPEDSSENKDATDGESVKPEESADAADWQGEQADDGNEPADVYAEPSVSLAATDAEIEAARAAMTAAMVNWDAEVDLSSYHLTLEQWNEIWPSVAEDNPDLFYMWDCTYETQGGMVVKCRFTYNPAYNQSHVAEYRAAIDKVFAEVIDSTMTPEQKATALHDYLVQHMVYDQNANNNLGIEKRNAYEALVNGIGVCEGYTQAYAALLNKAGIEVGYCRSKSMNHIWNYVKLNGSWYHADLTYDDTTAASQVGGTGYVRHEFFLLSDAAMESKDEKRRWDANAITCTDTSYDNSWHKTAPEKESAIYAVGGNSYYLKGKTTATPTGDIYTGAALVKKDGNGTETEVAEFFVENGWPMYQMSFSRLSCTKGVLYFNVGNAVYSYDPSKGAAPEKVYQYESDAGWIVTGLLAEGRKFTLEIYDPKAYKLIETIKIGLDQEEQKNFAFAEGARTATYGDAAFTVTAKGQESGATVSYRSSDPSVASVDPDTGEVTIRKAGSVMITAVASETTDYMEARSRYTLTISPKALTWDVSALKAGDRLDLITDRKATLFGELKLAGILEADQQTVQFQCPADLLAGVYGTVQEGSQRVTLSWKNDQNKAVLQGAGKDNYILPAALPEITGNIRITDDTEVSLNIGTVTKVPDAFLTIERLNTPEKIIKEITLKLMEKTGGLTQENIAVYDVELLINENGLGWRKATKEDFPSEGLVVTLPYPAGTGKDSHDFSVAHMFTEDMNGFRAGDVEYPTVTKTDGGITFRVYGLSPIAVGWKTANSAFTVTGNASAGQAGNVPDVEKHTAASRTGNPATGDNTPIMPYVWTALASLCGLAGLGIRKKKDR